MNNQQPLHNCINFYNDNTLLNQALNFSSDKNSLKYNRDSNIPDNSLPFNNLAYNIKETENEIYIENINKLDAIKISRRNPNIIERIYNKNVIHNIIHKKYQAFAIIGIFDLNFVKYLGYVSSAEEITTIIGYKVYLINSIELIKINNNINEPLAYNNFKENIKKLFSTKNFYFSNEYNISIAYNEFNRDIRANKKYLMNYPLLKLFLDNDIPNYFYCQIIFGFVSGQNNISMGNNSSNILDIAIIERYINGNIRANNNDLVYIKQIEFITNFKDKNNILKNAICSYICYENGESINNIIAFSPFKMILVEELNKFENIFCKINNLNNKISLKNFGDEIKTYNKNVLNNRIKYFDKSNFENAIDFYYNELCQRNLFWFIDINNNNLEYENCIKFIKGLFWKLIKVELKRTGLGKYLEKINKENDCIIYKKFDLLIQHYIKDKNNKRILLNKDKNIFQQVFDKHLYINPYISNEQNLLRTDEQIKSDDDYNKFKLLCVTWNVGGIQLKNDLDISEIFTRNYFYDNGQSPDIIVISLQEIVNLNFFNVLISKENTNIIETWQNILEIALKKIFPNEEYIVPFPLNFVGLFVIIFIKESLSGKVFHTDTEEIKKGKYNLGNKGFIVSSFQVMNKIFSIAGCHLESGAEDNKNDKRIKTIYDILNQEICTPSDSINKFNESDFWIILGDLNFRMSDLLYKQIINLIHERDFNGLYCMDQFHLAYEDINNLKLKNSVNEGKINFLPTYKFEKNSDNYDYKKKRVPSYCDRIFYCKKEGIKNLSYESVSYLKLSDHRPVTAAFEVFWEKNII